MLQSHELADPVMFRKTLMTLQSYEIVAPTPPQHGDVPETLAALQSDEPADLRLRNIGDVSKKRQHRDGRGSRGGR